MTRSTRRPRPPPSRNSRTIGDVQAQRGRMAPPKFWVIWADRPVALSNRQSWSASDGLVASKRLPPSGEKAGPVIDPGLGWSTGDPPVPSARSTHRVCRDPGRHQRLSSGPRRISHRATSPGTRAHSGPTSADGFPSFRPVCKEVGRPVAVGHENELRAIRGEAGLAVERLPAGRPGPVRPEGQDRFRRGSQAPRLTTSNRDLVEVPRQIEDKPAAVGGDVHGQPRPLAAVDPDRQPLSAESVLTNSPRRQQTTERTSNGVILS